MALTAAEIAHALGHGNEKPNGRGGWLVFCPVHETGGGHKTPSLDIDEKNGKVLWVCRTNPTGCTNKLITEALRDLGILPKASQRNGSHVQSRLAKTYDYRNEEGILLYQVCRWEPKKFTQRHPCPRCEDGSCGDKECKNGWVWNLKGVRRVLYNLPIIIQSAQQAIAANRKPKGIIITEGEKDADNLMEKCGVITTTNSEGAEKWHGEFNQFYRGRRAVILPDNDEAGRRHALIIARNLKDIAEEIRIVHLPGLPEKGDVSDWLGFGGTRDQLLALIEGTPAWKDGDTSPRVLIPAGTGPDPTLLAPAWSEDHIALQFVKAQGKDYRYVALWGKWMVWTGSQWGRDETLTAYNAIRDHCRQVAAEAFLDSDGEAGPKVAKSLASARTVNAVEKMATADRNIAADIEQWDENQWALNTPDGVVDLQTGEMRPHRREEYLSKITAVAPAQYADCPNFLAFLDRIMSGDDGMIQFLKRMMGYYLTGSTREQALFFAYGSGANGKGVLMNTFKRLLKDYATSTQMETLTVSRGERHPTEIADLKGARLVITSETGEGRWNEARIKQFTGGDPLKARYMHRDFFEFYPTFKLLISGNHEPRLRNVDRAMRRRLLLIPFNVIIPDREQDKELVEHLRNEWPAILRWALEGCLEWQKLKSLEPPDQVLGATKDYFEGEDSIGAWLTERCLTKFDKDYDGQNLWCASADVYGDWKTWAEKNGDYAGSQKRLTEQLRQRGFGVERNGAGMRGVEGMALKATGS